MLDKLGLIEDRLIKIESKVNKLEKDRIDLQDYMQYQDPLPPVPKKGRPESFPTCLKATSDIDFTLNDSQLEPQENKQFLVSDCCRLIKLYTKNNRLITGRILH